MPEMVNDFLILTKGKNKINKVDFVCLFACQKDGLQNA